MELDVTAMHIKSILLKALIKKYFWKGAYSGLDLVPASVVRDMES